MSALAQSLLAFQTDAPDIHKDATNPHFGNRFASLDNVMDAIRPKLNANGLVLLQFPTITETGHPALRTRIVHAESGESVEDTMPLAIAKPGPQEQGSAITYARRYALLSILGLVADEDDDGHAATKSAGEPRATKSAREPKPNDRVDSGGAESSPAENPVAKAQAAAEAAKAARTPQDGGDPGEVVITLGKKYAGKKIGEVPRSYLEWLTSKFEPRTAEQRRIVFAANIYLGRDQEALVGGGLSPADDDIPF